MVSKKKCVLCNIEWDEKENSGFNEIHQLSKLHVKNSINRDLRRKASRKRHALLRKKKDKETTAPCNEIGCKLTWI